MHVFGGGLREKGRERTEERSNGRSLFGCGALVSSVIGPRPCASRSQSRRDAIVTFGLAFSHANPALLLRPQVGGSCISLPSSSVMAVLSTLRPDKAQIDRLVKAYARHRPVIQKFILAGFIIHSFRYTAKTFTAKAPSSNSRKGKGKDGQDDKGNGKPSRVAVRITLSDLCHAKIECILPEGGRCILYALVTSSTDSDTQLE